MFSFLQSGDLLYVRVIYSLVTHDGVRSNCSEYRMLSALMSMPVIFKQINSAVTAEGMRWLRWEVHDGRIPEGVARRQGGDGGKGGGCHVEQTSRMPGSIWTFFWGWVGSIISNGPLSAFLIRFYSDSLLYFILLPSCGRNKKSIWYSSQISKGKKKKSKLSKMEIEVTTMASLTEYSTNWTTNNIPFSVD